MADKSKTIVQHDGRPIFRFRGLPRRRLCTIIGIGVALSLALLLITLQTFLLLPESGSGRLESRTLARLFRFARQGRDTSKYSIVISTYNRYEHLLQSLSHYSSADLPNLDSIFISWGLGGVDPPESLNLTSYAVPVHLHRAQTNSLNERFRLSPLLKTRAILFVDDDILISAQAVEFAFRAWQRFGRREPYQSIVGFSRRLHRIQESSRDSDGDGGGRIVYYVFSSSASGANYSMVLTDSAFLGADLVDLFWSNDRRMRLARKYVDDHMNCEDILMNFVASIHSGLPPLALDVPHQIKVIRSPVNSRNTGGGGSLHDKKDHFVARATCIAYFIDTLGRGVDPLRVTDLAISRNPADTRHLVDLEEVYRP